MSNFKDLEEKIKHIDLVEESKTSHLEDMLQRLKAELEETRNQALNERKEVYKEMAFEIKALLGAANKEMLICSTYIKSHEYTFEETNLKLPDLYYHLDEVSLDELSFIKEAVAKQPEFMMEEFYEFCNRYFDKFCNELKTDYNVSDFWKKVTPIGRTSSFRCHSTAVDNNIWLNADDSIDIKSAVKNFLEDYEKDFYGGISYLTNMVSEREEDDKVYFALDPNLNKALGYIENLENEEWHFLHDVSDELRLEHDVLCDICDGKFMDYLAEKLELGTVIFATIKGYKENAQNAFTDFLKEENERLEIEKEDLEPEM